MKTYKIITAVNNEKVKEFESFLNQSSNIGLGYGMDSLLGLVDQMTYLTNAIKDLADEKIKSVLVSDTDKILSDKYCDEEDICSFMKFIECRYVEEPFFGDDDKLTHFKVKEYSFDNDEDAKLFYTMSDEDGEE